MPRSEDERPKPPWFNDPKFLRVGPSARLQRAGKKLRVAKAKIV
jgi:hypothetical protein